MSYLRDELREARREYAAVRYPGDLAGEFLTPRMRWRGIALFGGLGTGAIAAAVLVAAMLLGPMMSSGNAQARNSLPEQLGIRLPSLPAIPGMPENLSLRSISPDLTFPSTWHIPFWDDQKSSPESDSSEHA